MFRQIVFGVPTWGRYYWPAYLVIASLGFLTAELIGIATNVANTLSDFSRYELGEYPGEPLFAHPWPWWLSLILYCIFTVWITGHIWFDIWG